MLRTCLCVLVVILSIDKILSISERSYNKTIVCYVGTYASTREGRGAFTIDNVDPSLCSHVIFGHAHLKSDASIYVLESWDTFMVNHSKLTSLKRMYPDVKFLVTIGGWHSSTLFPPIAHDGQLRRTFAENVMKFIRDNGFDGADICWLYPSKRAGSLFDRQNFVEMLKELKKQLKPQNFLLTAMLGSSYDTIDNGYDLKAISEHIDMMNVISYDYNGFWSPNMQPNAPMHSSDKWNVEYAITYMLKSGASPDQLTLGIPLYGRYFFAANDTLTKGRHITFGDKFESRNISLGQYTQDSSGIIAYGEICIELMNHGKWSRYWDAKSSTPYIVHEDILISYDDAESTAFKVQFAIEQNLSGVMVYSQDHDDFMGDCFMGHTYPLLKSINDQLQKYSNEIKPTTKSIVDDYDKINSSLSVDNVASCNYVCVQIILLFVSILFVVDWVIIVQMFE